MSFYSLMTMNAAAMLDNSYMCRQEDQPAFSYDYNEKATKKSVLEGINLHADNAMFYQLIASQPGVDADNIEQRRQDNEIILRTLIYVDFESVFSPQKVQDNQRKRIKHSIYSQSEEDIDVKCSVLFKDGFSIKYEDGEVRTYIPFDKSGNMSRHYLITFVDKAIFPEVDRRLMLGMDFSSIKVVPSKYFAYRGLYLSDGVRVEEELNKELNQETVLVIDDDTHDYMRNGEIQLVPVITVEKNALENNGEFKSVEGKQKIRLKSFDGEGIISPAYAQYLNSSRRREINTERLGVSFQIRMPFTKGMLHQVDFHRFFEEQIGKRDYYIKDIFGIPRRIADAQIILTKSMFKCADWLRDYQNSHPEIKDPMEWFFKMFHEYDHALYVCSSDSNMGSRNVTLNYQFLNTMAIAPKDLEALVNRHLNEAHSLTETGAKYAVDMTEYVADLLFEDEGAASPIPAWRYALDLNPDFVKDPYVKRLLEMEEKSRVKDICSGKIIVDGVLKYLSGDLLAFLIHMIYNKKARNDGGAGAENGLGVIAKGGFIIDAHVNQAVVSRLRKQLIRTGKFYTADHERLGLAQDKRYSVLRNPHLSRNEQCSLRPYIPDKDDVNNIYNRYFSHLNNVIMFPYESVDAMSLGGADYDGDKVKIILDGAVNRAILKGSYTQEGKEYVRKLPIVKIPSLESNSEPTPIIIPYKLVKNTFCNQVGLISDLAIRIGKMEYGSDSSGSLSLKNKCAECTVATGLEIDAVKTGKRPDLKDLKKASDAASSSKYDYFLRREDIIKGLRLEEVSRLKISISDNGEAGRFGGEIFKAEKAKYVGKKKKQLECIMNAELIPLDASAPVIDRLPGYFLKDLYNAQTFKAKTDANEGTGRVREIVLFKFQTDEMTDEYNTTWAKKLEQEPGGEEKLKKLTGLIKAYGKVAQDARYIREQKEKASRSNNMNKIWFLMTKIYDVNAESLPLTHTEIPDAIEIAHNDLMNIFETTDEVDRAIERMKKADWITASNEEREAVLYQILGTDLLLDETKEILLCNEPDAFNFLLFYLYEIKNELLLQSQADAVDLSSRKQTKYLRGYSSDDYRMLFNEYIIGQNKKESKKLWNDRIINLCRERLNAEDMFRDDFDSALKYYYACRSADPNRHFLWDVFTTNEILRNVYIKPREQ